MTTTRPTVFLLGDGGRASGDVVGVWDDAFDVVAPYAPGREGREGGLDAGVDAVARAIRDSGATRWLLVGQGAGGVLAAAVAAQTLSGALPLFGLAGLVLVGDEAVALAQDAHVEVPTLCRADGGDLAGSVGRFWHERAGRGPVVPAQTARLIASDRVTQRVRGALARRAVADDPDYEPRVLTPDQLTTLRAVADRVVPQDARAVDLAARVDTRLATGAGDGWRHAALPDDVTAYRLALTALTGVAELSADGQDEVLRAVADGRHAPAGSELSAELLVLWFEDARDDLVTQWVGHPATAARLGFDGFADGGDRTGRVGFVRVGAGELDEWEPRAVSGTSDAVEAHG